MSPIWALFGPKTAVVVSLPLHWQAARHVRCFGRKAEKKTVLNKSHAFTIMGGSGED